MRILVNGVLPYDSGKTTFALSLIRAFKEVNAQIFPLKPVAGHNAWYSFGTILRSLDLKTLAGNDSIRYYDETGYNINLINPFAVLFAPIDIEAINYDMTLYNELMNKGYPVILRLTIDCNSGTTKSFILNVLDLVPQGLRDYIIDLSKELSAEKISLNKLKELIDDSPYIVDNCIKELFKQHENVIIESYNDAVSPSYMTTDVDYVFTVSPGKAILYSGEEFKKGLALIQLPPWLIRTSTLIKYIKPLKTFIVYPNEYIVSHEVLDYLKT